MPLACLENPPENQNPCGLNLSCSCSAHVWVAWGLQNHSLSCLEPFVGIAQTQHGWKPMPELQVLAQIRNWLWLHQCNLKTRWGWSLYLSRSPVAGQETTCWDKALWLKSWKITVGFRCPGHYPRWHPPCRPPSPAVLSCTSPNQAPERWRNIVKSH